MTAIRDYQPSDEPEWLSAWGRTVVTSHAWGLPAYQSKPIYRRESVELVVVGGCGTIGGFIDIELETQPGELGGLGDTRCGFVWEFGLVPALRGQGLGRALVQSAEERLLARGIRRMEFWSMDDNAQRFYQALGMREINRHWRFWVRPRREDLADRRPASFNPEYMHATASLEEWPKVAERWQVVTDPPLEPHLCYGFDHRF